MQVALVLVLVRAQDPAVGRNRRALLHDDDVARDELARLDLVLLAVADDDRLHGDAGLELRDDVARLLLLIPPDESVEHEDTDDDAELLQEGGGGGSARPAEQGRGSSASEGGRTHIDPVAQAGTQDDSDLHLHKESDRGGGAAPRRSVTEEEEDEPNERGREDARRRGWARGRSR